MEREISNAIMIDSLDAIIERENWKLQMDKTTGLLAEIQSKVAPKVEHLLKENKNIIENRQIIKDSVSHSPMLSNSHERGNEIERLANLFTHSPGFFTANAINIRNDVSHSNVLLKEKTTTQIHNEFDNYNHLECNKHNKTPVSPDIKVKRNVRFGEYSPLNPANQMNSQPFLGIGEYDDKKKKILELQRKEYIDYVSKVKHEKSISGLPKLAAFSCEEAFKTAMESNNLEKNKSDSINNQENKIKLVPYVDGIESCVLDEEQQKETNRLRQELYRFELSKQIEEKKRLDKELKHREQMEDLAIEKAAKDQEEKLKREFEKESEKRTLAQLQKQLAQEKLKNELMKRQRELATAERISRKVLKHTPSYQASLEDKNNDNISLCPPQNTSFDNAPLPTSRIRAPRKIDYRDVSCNTNMFNNPCMNHDILLPLAKPKMERAHVTFANESPIRKNVHNPAVLLPVTKNMIIDSPLTLALAGLNENDGTCEAIEPTETAYRNQVDSEWYYLHK